LNSADNTNKPTHQTIYLVEDDIDDQEFLEEAILSQAPGIQFKSFTNSLKFIKELEHTPDHLLPGLVVLDYNIPEINGAEILKHLNQHERYSSISKIIWSTSNSEEFRKNCLELGAKAYLVKPSSFSGINDIAREILSFMQP
jgi:CheY-like chemotaxis protein